MKSRYVGIAVTIALVLTVAVGGVAIAKQAGIVVGNDKVKACYNKQNGNLRVVERASDCRNSEGFVSWDRSGGSLGSGQLQSQPIEGDFTVAASGGRFAIVNCPSGQIVTGGGYLSPVIGKYVTASYPVSSSAWAVQVTGATPGESFKVYAVCVTSQ